MKTFVCFCFLLGATFVRGQDETTVSVETSIPANVASNETNVETTGMEVNASETTFTTLKNETITPDSNSETTASFEDLLTTVSNGSDSETTASFGDLWTTASNGSDSETTASFGDLWTTASNGSDSETTASFGDLWTTASDGSDSETTASFGDLWTTASNGSDSETTASFEDLWTTAAAVQENITTLDPAELFTETLQPALNIANFTDPGENGTEDQSTTQTPVSPETTVGGPAHTEIPEVTDTTVESPGMVTEAFEETTNRTDFETTEVTGLTSTAPTPNTTASSESSTSEQPQPTSSGIFGGFDVETIGLITAFAVGAVFVVIISFVICRKCIKDPPDGKYTLMKSSE